MPYQPEKQEDSMEEEEDKGMAPPTRQPIKPFPSLPISSIRIPNKICFNIEYKINTISSSKNTFTLTSALDLELLRYGLEKMPSICCQHQPTQVVY